MPEGLPVGGASPAGRSDSGGRRDSRDTAALDRPLPEPSRSRPGFFCWLVLGFFALEFAVRQTHTATSSRAGEEERVLLQAFLQGGLMALGYVVLLWRRLIGGRFCTLRRDVPVAAIVMAWQVLIFVSALVGLYQGHESRYVVNDLYKFSLLPGFFFLFCLGIRDLGEVEFILKGAAVIYCAALTVHMVQYVTVLPVRCYVPTIRHAPMMALVLAYWAGRGRRRALRWMCGLGLLEIPAALVFAQPVGMTATILFGAAVGLFLGVGWVRRPVLVGGGLLLVLLAGWALMGFPDPNLRESGQRRTLVGKTEFLRQDAPAVDVLDAVSSGGGLEFPIFYEKFRRSPGRLLIGFGLGNVYVREWGDPSVFFSRRPWTEAVHYITFPWLEVLVRCGLPALTLLLLLWLSFVLRAEALLPRVPLASLCRVVAWVLLVFWMANNPIHYAFPLFCLLFVALLRAPPKERDRGAAARSA